MSEGASITQVQDARLTKAAGWVLSTIGALLVISVCWAANNINTLNQTVAGLVATQAAQNAAIVSRIDVNDARDAVQDARLNKVERDVAVIEGKTFRGVPGYQEPRRGN